MNTFTNMTLEQNQLKSLPASTAAHRKSATHGGQSAARPTACTAGKWESELSRSLPWTTVTVAAGYVWAKISTSAASAEGSGGRWEGSCTAYHHSTPVCCLAYAFASSLPTTAACTPPSLNTHVLRSWAGVLMRSRA